MMMKIALTGKGGSGKTTIAAHLGRVLSERGNSVLLVDADASRNLATLLAHEDTTPINEMKDVVNQRARIEGGLVNLNPYVRDLIDKYAVDVSQNLRLLVIGGVEKAGMGCLCPENSMLRSLLRELVLKRDEIVIIDMEAGLEIMGRGTVKNVDTILVIAEPGYGSISVTKEILKFAKEMGVEARVVANKVRNKSDEKYLSEYFEPMQTIPADEGVRESSIKGQLLSDGDFYDSIVKLSKKLTK